MAIDLDALKRRAAAVGPVAIAADDHDAVVVSPAKGLNGSDLNIAQVCDSWSDEKSATRRTFNILRQLWPEQFRLNQLTGDITFKGRVIDGMEFQDAHFYIDELLQSQTKMTRAQDAQSVIRTLAHKNRFHPVAQYLTLIGKDSSLETISAEEVAKRVLGVTDPLQVRYLECWLAGAAARGLSEDGCDFPEVLTLVSPRQGIGKSEFFRSLASQPWYSGSFSDQEGKDQLLSLHANWVNEIAELDMYTSRSKDFKDLKSTLTLVDDMLRVHYGTKNERRYRRFVIGATANEEAMFANDDEQRRFWVIQPKPTTSCERLDIMWLRENRDAILATAVRRWWELGDDAFKLTTEERKATIRVNKEHRKELACEDKIVQYLESRDIKRISTSEVAEYCLGDKSANTGLLRTIGTILKEEGYEKVSHGVKLGKKFRTLYVHPERTKDFNPSIEYRQSF